MDLFNNIASIYILFGGAVTLLLGIEQLTGKPERARYNVVLFFISILAAIVLFNHVLFANGITTQCPWTAFLYLTSLCAVGPLTYLYYHILMFPGRRIRARRLRRLIPAGFILVVEIILQAQPEEVKRHALDVLFNTNEFSFLLPLLFSAGAVFVGHQVVIVIEGSLLWNDSKMKNGVRLIVTLEIMNIVATIPVIIWMFIRQEFLFLIAAALVSTVMIIVFLTNNRYPRIFNHMKKELVRRKYERSFLKGIDTGKIQARLFNLMEEDKVYRDSELTLQSLAESLLLTPHQLSQFLNEQLRTNFTGFVNKYRIEEAKSLLRKRTDHTILTICFFVGFNSKSAFNTVFKKFTGRTPSEYRNFND
jgi:AraC-like DNA-binding protein